jgi:hypothetical protein
MSFTEIVSGEKGATRQSWRKHSVRDLLVAIIAKHPKASDRELLQEFAAQCREDDDYLVACIEYSFDNAIAALRRENNRITADERAKRAAERANEAAEHAKNVARIKSGVVLGNLRMPNGKRLVDCFGRECQHFGGWVQRVGVEVGPDNLVGDKLSEKDLRALYRA